MSDSPARTQQSSGTAKFMRDAGKVYDPDHKLWAPAKWIVGIFQYLVAIVLVTIAEGFKSIVSGKKPQGRRRALAQ
ncbi:hypothetical protein TI39_contig595g00002 [Zymoseptoria brevis]|uniref:Uncharacterized protein n=1 Tax=Zymoseptoria brevis TaxID=1047168 RepID=A0A0F4GL24_9PEZI|nr:hypothetical protein TI39_contig595g00002 [Zymoseptoria brevis]